MNDFPLNILTFPLWWYTTGFSVFKDWAKRKYHYHLQKTGLLVFAKHLKEPLYGDYTRSGIIISFFVRIILLVYKLIIFVLHVLLIGVLGFAYLVLLPALTMIIVFQIFSI